MTETARPGATSAPKPAFVNGRTTLDRGLRRTPGRRTSGLDIPAAGHGVAGAGMPGGDAAGEPVMPVLPGIAESLVYWQDGCALSCRLVAIFCGAMGEAASARLARVQEAGERAVSAAQAIAAAGPGDRAELAWGYLQESIDDSFAGALESLERIARPAGEIIELLAPPADQPAEARAADRAA